MRAVFVLGILTDYERKSTSHLVFFFTLGEFQFAISFWRH